MLETKAMFKRRVRDNKILDLYNTYRIVGGSKREVSAEKIAKECKTSVTTVKRITQELEATFQQLKLNEVAS